jgi:sugar/nucleoside kinase (ribokinase family)
MTQQVIDTMGAGDAFLAVTAPFARHGRMEDLLLIGNAAGAMKTQIVGHRQSITKDALIRYMVDVWT